MRLVSANYQPHSGRVFLQQTECFGHMLVWPHDEDIVEVSEEIDLWHRCLHVFKRWVQGHGEQQGAKRVALPNPCSSISNVLSAMQQRAWPPVGPAQVRQALRHTL